MIAISAADATERALRGTRESWARAWYGVAPTPGELAAARLLGVTAEPVDAGALELVV